MPLLRGVVLVLSLITCLLSSGGFLSGASAGETKAERVCLDGSAANVLHRLPRMTRKFGGATANMAKLKPEIFIPCDGNNVCENPDFENFMDNIEEKLKSGPSAEAGSDSWDAYLDSLLVYGVFGIAFAVLFVVGAIFFFSFRHFCGLCGSARITKRDEMYSETQVLGTSLYLFIFIVFLTVLIFLGEFKGNRALTGAQYEVVDGKAPLEMRKLIASASSPVTTAIVSTSSALVSSITRFNSTVTAAVDFNSIHRSFRCLDSALDTVSESNIQYFIDTISDVETSLTKLPTKATVNAQIDSLVKIADDTKPIMDAARAALDDVSGNITLIDITSVISDYDSLSTTLDNDLKPNLQSIKTGFDSLGNPTTGLPTKSSVTDAATLAASMRDTQSERTAGNKADLASKLRTVEIKLGQLTDTSVLADNFASADAAIGTALSTLTSLESSLNTFKGAVGTFPDSQARIVAALDDGITLLDGFSIDDIKASLESVQTFLDDLPDVSTLSTKIQNIKKVEDDIPCILDIVDQIKAVNTSLAVLPSEFDDVEDDINKLNDTVKKDLDQLDAATDFLDEMNEKLEALPSFDTGLAELDNAKAELATAKTSLQEAKSEVNALTGDTTVPLSEVDDILAKIATLKQQIQAGSLLRPSPASVDALRDLNTDKASAVTALNQMVDILDAWQAAGYPQTGVCVDGANAGSPCGTGPNQCGAGATAGGCPFPYDPLSQMVDLLNGVSTTLDSVPDPSTVSAAADAAISNIDSVPRADRNKLSDLKTEIDTIKPKIADYKSQLDDFEQKVDTIDSELDVNQLKAEYNNLDGVIDSARADLSTYKASAVDFKAQVVDLRNQFDIDEVIANEKIAYNMIFSNLTDFLSTLRTTATKEWIQANSIGAAMDKIVDAAAVLLTELDVSSFDIETEYRNSAAPRILTALYSINGDSASKYGSIYDIAMFADRATSENPHTPSNKRWLGRASCLSSTIFLFRGPIK